MTCLAATNGFSSASLIFRTFTYFDIQTSGTSGMFNADAFTHSHRLVYQIVSCQNNKYGYVPNKENPKLTAVPFGFPFADQHTVAYLQTNKCIYTYIHTHNIYIYIYAPICCVLKLNARCALTHVQKNDESAADAQRPKNRHVLGRGPKKRIATPNSSSIRDYSCTESVHHLKVCTCGQEVRPNAPSRGKVGQRSFKALITVPPSVKLPQNQGSARFIAFSWVVMPVVGTTKCFKVSSFPSIITSASIQPFDCREPLMNSMKRG